MTEEICCRIWTTGISAVPPILSIFANLPFSFQMILILTPQLSSSWGHTRLAFINCICKVYSSNFVIKHQPPTRRGPVNGLLSTNWTWLHQSAVDSYISYSLLRNRGMMVSGLQSLSIAPRLSPCHHGQWMEQLDHEATRGNQDISLAFLTPSCPYLGPISAVIYFACLLTETCTILGRENVMVISLAIFLSRYIHWTRLYERGHGQCYSSVIAVSVPARTGEKREDHPPPPGTGGVPTNKRGQ